MAVVLAHLGHVLLEDLGAGVSAVIRACPL